MKNNVMYYRDNVEVKYVCYNKSIQAYPVHTHANHAVFCYITDGAVRVALDSKEYTCYPGQGFYVMPDVPHGFKPENNKPYSMICLLYTIRIPKQNSINSSELSIACFNQLKQSILKAPENMLSIKEMAQSICMSPYHMIRKFKTDFGLTPHQFQIQCRIRKAQKLLEEGKSVTEVAYETGFCDQSHFDRCFRKIVRLTPTGYKQAVKRILRHNAVKKY